MKEFAQEHPWMTFFLGLAVVNGIVEVVAGPRLEKAFANLSGPQPKSAPAAATSAAMGLFGASPDVRAHAARAVDQTYSWIV